MILLHLPTQIRSPIRGERVRVVGQNLLTPQGNKHFDSHVIKSCCLKQRQIFLCQPGSSKHFFIRSCFLKPRQICVPAGVKQTSFFAFLSLMSGHAGNSEFYFPSMFQNSLFPLGQVMKCSLTKSTKQNTQMHTHISRESVNRRKNVTVIVFNNYSPKWR